MPRGPVCMPAEFETGPVCMPAKFVPGRDWTNPVCTGRVCTRPRLNRPSCYWVNLLYEKIKKYSCFGWGNKYCIRIAPNLYWATNKFAVTQQSPSLVAVRSEECFAEVQWKFCPGTSISSSCRLPELYHSSFIYIIGSIQHNFYGHWDCQYWKFIGPPGQS